MSPGLELAWLLEKVMHFSQVRRDLGGANQAKSQVK